MSSKFLIIHNPAAGRWQRKRLTKLHTLLERSGYSVISRPTTRRGDARDAALTAAGIDVIVAAGGDGTVNEVLTGLLKRGAGSDIPAIAFFPMGTANVLAWELNLPRKPDAFVRMIQANRRIETTPARANGHPFLLMASAGLDARAVAALNPGIKRVIGGAAYLLAAISAMRQAEPRYTVTVDGKTTEARSVIVTRARRYGGPFVLTRDAGLKTAALHVVLMQSYGWTAALRYGWGLLRGRLARLGDVTVVPGRAVAVHGPVGEPVQLDGDVATALPVEIALETRTISFVVPGRPA